MLRSVNKIGRRDFLFALGVSASGLALGSPIKLLERVQSKFAESTPAQVWTSGKGQLALYTSKAGHLDYLAYFAPAEKFASYAADGRFPVFFTSHLSNSKSAFWNFIEILLQARDEAQNWSLSLSEDIEKYILLAQSFNYELEVEKQKQAQQHLYRDIDIKQNHFLEIEIPLLLYEHKKSKVVELRREKIKRYIDQVVPYLETVNYRKIIEQYQLICFGEQHDESSTKIELKNHLEEFLSLGVNTIGFEFIPSQEQDFLNNFNWRKAMDREHLLALIANGWGNAVDYYQLALRASQLGMRLVGLNHNRKYRPELVGLHLYSRSFQMAHYVARVFEENPRAKMITLTGSSHNVYGTDQFQSSLVIPYHFQTPTIPTILKKYYGVSTQTVDIVGAKADLDRFGEGSLEAELRKIGLGMKRFMTKIPDFSDAEKLSDSARGFDYVIHLPQREA